uniref:CUB domain-containing protein n=1 Tax=Panagrolaimus sp. PS1159 TaxID=55785 RepID=A0AC35FS56_9BILA
MNLFFPYKLKYNSNFDIVTFTTFSNSLSVKLNTTSQGTWSAIQAAIITYVDGSDLNSCPLAGETFDFIENSEQIIPISNTYGSGEYDYKKCSWFFEINSLQQLKVVVQSIQIAEEVELILNADGKMVKNFSTSDISQVFYFYGTSFNLTYEYKFANTTEIKFFLLISAITLPSENYTTDGCQMPEFNDTLSKTIYTNIDYNIGYPAYQKCKNLINIPRNFEGILSITEYLFEGCCDKLSVIYGTNIVQSIGWDNKYPNFYTLNRDVDGGELVFVSDGNTQGAGFTAELQLYGDISPLKRTYKWKKLFRMSMC